MIINARYADPAPATEPVRTQFTGFRTAISGRRYYSPGTGRWLSRDPLEEEGGVNVYGFVKNDSVNFRDNFGMDFIDEYLEGIGYKAFQTGIGSYHGRRVAPPVPNQLGGTTWVLDEKHKAKPEDDLTFEEDGCCVKIAKIDAIDVYVMSWVVDDLLGGNASIANVGYTGRGYAEIMGHERKRKMAVATAYYAYIETMQKQSGLSCGKICAGTLAESKKKLTDWYIQVRRQTIDSFNNYVGTEQASISGENNNETRTRLPNGVILFEHFNNPYTIQTPAVITLPQCPQ